MRICEYNKNIYQDDSFIIRVINSYNVLFLFKRTVVLYIMEIQWPKLHINRYKYWKRRLKPISLYTDQGLGPALFAIFAKMLQFLHMNGQQSINMFNLIWICNCALNHSFLVCVWKFYMNFINKPIIYAIFNNIKRTLSKQKNKSNY